MIELDAMPMETETRTECIAIRVYENDSVIEDVFVEARRCIVPAQTERRLCDRT